MDHPQLNCLILYDGKCKYCNGIVGFVSAIDKNGVIRFAWLQGETGQQLLKQYNLPPGYNDSFLFLLNRRLYDRTAASCRVLWQLNPFWKVAGTLLWLVPFFLRDAVYDLIARNRYKWFGEYEACTIPDEKFRSRFLP